MNDTFFARHRLVLLVSALSLAVPLGLVGSVAGAAESGAEVATEANKPAEIEFSAAQQHADPFHDIKLDVLFTEPDGTPRRVPAFWAGGQRWKVRYASPQLGSHSWRSEASDTTDAGLHGVRGTVKVGKYHGANPLYKHGPIRVAADRRHFEHADGTDFFWLGDTWWMGLCHRLHWPEDFQQLAADRKEKGFNVVQIVAGLYPDMDPFDPRGANEAGFPWEKDYARIRPEYFDAADVRLQHLVDAGLAPCLVGAWGYFMPWMEVEKMNEHWRYLIGRYGAWPVIWCAAGEANLPWYLAKGFPYDDRAQVHEWTQVLQFIRDTDPWRRPLTIHPTAINRYTARNATDDPALLDFDMLQTPHGQREAVPVTIRAARESYEAQPVMPVVNGEAAYEMLSDSLPTAWTRAMFWVCLTNGACGHTYGANGIWQVNRRGEPHGKSPHGGTYGVISWDDAMRLPGSTQMALGKKFFLSLPWTKLVPMPESVRWADVPQGPTLADWIWFPAGDAHRDAPVETVYFRRTIELPAGANVKHAALSIAADDRYTVWLRGRELGSGADWHSPTVFDLAGVLRPGKNVLAVRAENAQTTAPANPAGLSVALEAELADAAKLRIVGDDEWRVAKAEAPGWRDPTFDDSKWDPAAVVAQYGSEPWGKLESAPSAGMPPQACGIGKRLRVVYALNAKAVVVAGLEPGAKYRVTLLDPVTGERTKGPEATTSERGDCKVAAPQHDHDWVLLLESA